MEQIFDRTELNKNLQERSLSASDAVISAISIYLVKTLKIISSFSLILFPSGSCENDIRPTLFGSVIITGGNTLIRGFSERLTRDLALRTPSSCKLKMISPSGPKVCYEFSSFSKLDRVIMLHFFTTQGKTVCFLDWRFHSGIFAQLSKNGSLERGIFRIR